MEPAVRDVVIPAEFYCVLGPLAKMTQNGKCPKNAIRFPKGGMGALAMQLGRPLGM